MISLRLRRQHNTAAVRLLVPLALLLTPSPAAAWADSYAGRLEAQALIQTLRVDLLTHDSATAVLTRWCADHRLAAPPVVLARRVKVERVSPSTEVRALLAVGADEPLEYRRVQLVCGDKVLSEADNWYVPARLTPEMNLALRTTQTPFGAVVRPLDFRRRTLESTLLLEALTPGWEMRAKPRTRSGGLPLPAVLLRHRALLNTSAGTPFSLVTEDYGRDLLAFAPPGRR